MLQLTPWLLLTATDQFVFAVATQIFPEASLPSVAKSGSMRVPTYTLDQVEPPLELLRTSQQSVGVQPFLLVVVMITMPEAYKEGKARSYYGALPFVIKQMLLL
jgi:hypothetical protein